MWKRLKLKLYDISTSHDIYTSQESVEFGAGYRLGHKMRAFDIDLERRLDDEELIPVNCNNNFFHILATCNHDRIKVVWCSIL